MKSILKWVGVTLGVVIGFIALVVLAFYAFSEARLKRVYYIANESVTIPKDQEVLIEGSNQGNQ